jgi:hypothetical protein
LVFFNKQGIGPVENGGKKQQANPQRLSPSVKEQGCNREQHISIGFVLNQVVEYNRCRKEVKKKHQAGENHISPHVCVFYFNRLFSILQDHTEFTTRFFIPRYFVCLQGKQKDVPDFSVHPFGQYDPAWPAISPD